MAVKQDTDSELAQPHDSRVTCGTLPLVVTKIVLSWSFNAAAASGICPTRQSIWARTSAQSPFSVLPASLLRGR